MLPRVQNSGEEAGKNFLSFGGHQCAICKGLTFPFLLAGNDNVLNSAVTLCSFPPWGLCQNSFYIGNQLVLEPFWGWLCINIRYLLLLFVAQGISRKRLGTSNAHFYRQKIAVGKTTRCAEHNVLIQRTELSLPGSHEHKTPGTHVS